MNSNNRREFLKKSILGASGAALIPGTIKAYTTGSSENTLTEELPGRLLGKTGIKTPLISMGTSGTTNPNFVKAAYDAGVKLFFSANYYGEGNNEILVGDALRAKPRDSYVIGTAASPDGLDRRTGLLTAEFTAAGYMKKAEESLKRFSLDHIDILLFPYAGKKEALLHEGVLKTMEQLKKQGKVKFVGIASHSDTVEALDAAASAGVYDVAMISYNFRIQDRTLLDTSIANAVKAGMGVVAMKSTAGAFRNKSGPQLNSNAVLKWVLQNKNIASIVSGMSSVDELQKNLAMIRDLKMSDQELKDLGMASMGSGTGLYCQQCKQCIPQCPHQLDIPTLMRSYMYAYGYKNTEQAWYTLAEAGISGNPCALCDVCKVNCISGFDVKSKISDIARLRDVPLDFVKA